MKMFIRQAEALEQLLNHCTQEGDSYNPSDVAIKSTALQTLLTDARQSIEAVRNAKNNLTEAINIRHRAFDSLPAMGTRIIRSLKAVKASPDMIADINRIRLKFRYPSFRIIQRSAQQTGDDAENPSSGTPRGPISQLSFGLREENFASIIGLLKKESAYSPNEADLTIESLEAKLEELHSGNSLVTQAKVLLQNARKHCRQLVFDEDGIYGIGTRVKDYYISAFGFSDEKFKMIRKIHFVR